MEALPLRTGRTNCVTNMQQDMVEQTLAIIASMMQQAAHDATLYCAEARRTVILPRDIELALKRLVLTGMLPHLVGLPPLSRTRSRTRSRGWTRLPWQSWRTRL
jgi:hypothetical protein